MKRSLNLPQGHMSESSSTMIHLQTEQARGWGRATLQVLNLQIQTSVNSELCVL